MYYYTLSPEKSIENLDSSLQNGLTKTEALKRLKEYGLNISPEEKNITIGKIFLSSLTDPLICILAIILLINIFTNRFPDTYLVLIVIVLEFLLLFYEKNLSFRAISFFQKFAKTNTKVIRDGKIQYINPDYLVPGDIIHISGGDKIPADLRIISSNHLLTDESIFTGIKDLTEKKSTIITSDTPINDQFNMLFQGTFAVHGNALGIVVSTGKQTEYNKISSVKIPQKSEPFKIDKKLTNFSRVLSLIVFIVALIFFVIGLFLRKSAIDLLLVILSIATAILPGSFSILILIATAISITRLSRKKVIVKNLTAIETLGNTSVICLDKKGTITTNKLSVKKIILSDGVTFNINNLDYSPKGDYLINNKKIKPIDYPNLELLLTAITLCNDSAIEKQENGKWIPIGNSVEAACVAAAAKANLDPNDLNNKYPRLDTIPMLSEQEYMATLHDSSLQKKKFIFIKGSPEKILSMSSYRSHEEKTVKITLKDKKDMLALIDELAQKSYKVVAVAYKELSKNTEENITDTVLKYSVVYLGLIVLVDPIRLNASSTIMEAQKAGINVILFSDDHIQNSINTAKSIGIQVNKENIITESELSRLTDEQFFDIANRINTYIQVTPEQKFKVIDFWQKQGLIVTATGDDIEDIKALKQADLSIALGNSNDLAKEYSEIILFNKDFNCLLLAISQGRQMYENIRKSVLYLLAHNAAEAGIIFIALILGLPIPLLPLQILWLNLVTDGLLDKSLLFEKNDSYSMKQGVRFLQEKFITNNMLQKISLVGIFTTLVVVYIYKYYLDNFDIEYARSVVFVLLAFCSVFTAWSFRSINKSSTFSLKWSDNKTLLASAIISVLLQLLAIYLPFFQNIFHVKALSLADLILLFFISSLVLVVIEIEKYINIKISNNSKKVLA